MQKRLYISLQTEDSWKKILEQEVVDFSTTDWLRLTPQEELHITLFFLGSVDEELIPEIEDALADIASIQNSFTLTLNKILYTPVGEKPTMIWAKLGDALQFNILAGRVREELTYILGSTDDPEQVPHITLARFTKQASPPKELPVLAKSEFEGKKMTINKMTLIESKMTKTRSVQLELSNFAFSK